MWTHFSHLRAQKSHPKKRLANPKPQRIIPESNEMLIERDYEMPGRISKKSVCMELESSTQGTLSRSLNLVVFVAVNSMKPRRNSLWRLLIGTTWWLLSLGCPVKKKPTQEQFDLAAPVKIRNTNVSTLEIVTPWTITAKAAKKKNSRTQTILGSSLVKNDSPSRKRSFWGYQLAKGVVYFVQYTYPIVALLILSCSITYYTTAIHDSQR